MLRETSSANATAAASAGTVFELTKRNGTWHEHVIHAFTGGAFTARRFSVPADGFRRQIVRRDRNRRCRCRHCVQSLRG